MSIPFNMSSGPSFNNQKIYGVALGIVTNNKDPENLGRIKVKFPLREVENESDWIRIATLMAGKTMGSFFLPEVGDEVLLAFNHGNVEEPYMIGMLWNSKDTPPANNQDGKNNIRKIKSRCGHEIILNDEQGKETVEIHTKKGKKVLLDDQSGKVEIKDDQGKNTITIDGQGNSITINSGQTITIKTSSGSIEIAAGGITVNSNSSLKLKGQMVDIEAGANLNIKSSGMLKIEGTMVKIN